MIAGRWHKPSSGSPCAWCSSPRRAADRPPPGSEQRAGGAAQASTSRRSTRRCAAAISSPTPRSPGATPTTCTCAPLCARCAKRRSSVRSVPAGRERCAANASFFSMPQRPSPTLVAPALAACLAFAREARVVPQGGQASVGRQFAHAACARGAHRPVRKLTAHIDRQTPPRARLARRRQSI